MRAAYTVFQDGSDPARILRAADGGRGSSSAFYANLVSGHTDSALRFRLCLMQTGCCALILILPKAACSVLMHATQRHRTLHLYLTDFASSYDLLIGCSMLDSSLRPREMSSNQEKQLHGR